MNANSFIAFIKTDDICKDMNESDRSLPKGKNGKVTGLMKHELCGKIMTKFIGLKAETYGYLIDHGIEEKKQKAKKSVSLKENLNLKIIKTVSQQLKSRIKYPKEFIKNTQLILKIQQRFKMVGIMFFTEEINKIALSSNDNKRRVSTRFKLLNDFKSFIECSNDINVFYKSTKEDNPNGKRNRLLLMT